MKARRQVFYFSTRAIAKRKLERVLQSQSKIGCNPRSSTIDVIIEENDGVYDAFVKCQKSLMESEIKNDATDKKYLTLLADVLDFYRSSLTDKVSKDSYERLLRDKGVRISCKQRNPFLPAIKAICGPTKKSSLGRRAAALYLAHCEGIQPAQLSQFIEAEGGLVACQKKGSERLNPSAVADKAESEKEKILALKKAGKSFKVPSLSADLELGISLVLISKARDGTLTLLAHKPEDKPSLKRFKPLI